MINDKKPTLHLKKRRHMLSWLDAYVSGNAPLDCCRIIGVSHTAYYKWLDDDWFVDKLNIIHRKRYILKNISLNSIISDPKHKDCFNACKELDKKDKNGWFEKSELIKIDDVTKTDMVEKSISDLILILSSGNKNEEIDDKTE